MTTCPHVPPGDKHAQDVADLHHGDGSAVDFKEAKRRREEGDEGDAYR